MKFIPITDSARGFFEYYTDCKVGKIEDDSVFFVNPDCDMTSDRTYLDTFIYGFWIDLEHLEQVEE